MLGLSQVGGGGWLCHLVAPDFHTLVDPIECVLVAVVDLALVLVLGISRRLD